jgi:hypothetical protein
MVDISRKVQQAIWDDLTLVTAGNLNSSLLSYEERKALANRLQGCSNLENLREILHEVDSKGNLESMQSHLDDEETFFSRIDADLERHKSQIDALLESEEQNHVIPQDTHNHWTALISSMSSIKRKLKVAHKSQRNAITSLMEVSTRPKAKDKVVRNTVNEFIASVNQQSSADADFTKRLGSITNSLDSEAKELAAKSGVIKDPEVLRELTFGTGPLGRVAAAVLIAASALSFLMANPASAQTADSVRTEQVPSLNLTHDQKQTIINIMYTFYGVTRRLTYANDLSVDQLEGLMIKYESELDTGIASRTTKSLNQSLMYDYAKVIIALRLKGADNLANQAKYKDFLFQFIAQALNISELSTITINGFSHSFKKTRISDSKSYVAYLLITYFEDGYSHSKYTPRDERRILRILRIAANILLNYSSNRSHMIYTAVFLINHFPSDVNSNLLTVLYNYFMEYKDSTDLDALANCGLIAKSIVQHPLFVTDINNFRTIRKNFILLNKELFSQNIVGRVEEENAVIARRRMRQQQADSTSSANRQAENSLNW